MKRSFFQSLVFCLLLFMSVISMGQSVNTVSYKITYDAGSQVYTTWVVPNYNVPNSNNQAATEKGATAQFTVMVPKDFIINTITDLNGVWDKSPLKLGPGQANQVWSGYTLDPNHNYYVIGKSPTETDYGVFTIGQAVSLFSFKGNGCMGPVSVLPPTSLFIQAADVLYSLGVANSFYSRSGQPAGGNQNPLEQFKDVSGAPANCGATIIANADSPSTPSGTAVTTNVLGNDTNDGNPATISNSMVSISQNPTNGTVVINADGSIKYTPNASFIGTDCYVYQVCDKIITTSCDTAKVCVNVGCGVIDTPTNAMASPADICKGSSTTLTANCAVGSVLTWFSDAALTNTVTNIVSPNVTTIYYASCVSGTCKSASATITVTVNQKPILIVPAIYINSTICNGNTFNLLTYQYACTANANIVWYSDSELTNVLANTLVSPGVTTTYYAACTTQTCKSIGKETTVSVKICNIVANADSPSTPSGTAVTTNVLGNDTNNGNPATLTNSTINIGQNPINGTVVINADGSIKYTPNSGFSGTDCYVYRICDKNVTTTCDTAKVCVNVISIVQKVIYAFDDNNITSVNQSVSGNVLANDKVGTGIAPLLVSTTPVQLPQHGTVTINANGTYSYIPASGYTGNDTFKYKVCDSSMPAICDTATVSIFTKSSPSTTNNSPIALSDNVITKLNTTVTGNVMLNDNDPDTGQILTTTIVSGATNGVVTLNANGTYSYKPNSGFIGSDRFTYKVCDNGTPVLCDDAEVNLSIIEPNTTNLPPIANDDIYLAQPNVNINGNVLLNDVDPNGIGGLTIKTTPLVSPANGTLVLNSNGTFTYLPNAGFSGIDKFVYEVCNNQMPVQCSQAEVFFISKNNAIGNADLSIFKTVIGSKTREINDLITYKIVVRNLGSDLATNVIVKDSVTTGLVLISGTTTKGTFSSPLWNISSIAAGDSAILTVVAKVIAEGVSFNYAVIKNADQIDNNKINNISNICITVPFKLCSGQLIEASVPSNYLNVVWRDAQGNVVPSVGNNVLLTKAGVYTFTASNNTCPAGGCCPVIIVDSNDCCPANICIPFTIQKKKK